MKRSVLFLSLLAALILVPDVAFAAEPREIYGPVFLFILNIFAWITGVAGTVLNATAYYTVVNMGNFVNGDGIQNYDYIK